MMDVIKKITAEDVRKEIKDAMAESSRMLDIIDAVDTTAGVELTRCGVEMIREMSVTLGQAYRAVLTYLDNEEKKRLEQKKKGGSNE